MPFGTGTLLVIPENLFGTTQVSITHPVVPVGIPVVGTGNSDLNPINGGFVGVLDEYDEILTKGPQFTVLSDGRVQINTAGTVTIVGYADVSHTANNSTVGVVFTLERNAVVVLSARTVHAKLPNNGDISNLAGTGIISAEVGDIIGIAVASDTTGTVGIKASSLVFEFKAQ